MTDAYHERITAIREAVAIQVAVLSEVASDLREDGNVGLAADVEKIVSLLEHDSNGTDLNAEVDRVDDAIRGMKALSDRLHVLGIKHALLALDGARAVLRDRRNRLIADTQPIDVAEVEKLSERDKKE